MRRSGTKRQVKAARCVGKLVRYTSGYFWACVGATTVEYCLVPLCLGLATRAFFDSFTGTTEVGVWTAVAFIVAIQLSEVAANLAVVRTWSGFSYKAQTLMQRNMFAGILRGFGRHGLTVPPGDALSRFREDPPAITQGSMDGVCDLISRGTFAAVAAVLMWWIDPLLTVTALAPIVVGALVSDALGSRSRAYGAAALDSTTRLSRFLGEVVNAQLAVRVAGAKARVVDRLAEIGDVRRRLSLRDRVFAETVDSMNFHLVHVATGAVLLLGAAKIRGGAFSVGDFALFIVFLDQLTYLPAEIGRVITEMKRTQVSVRRMNALMPGEAPEAVVAAAPLYLKDRLPAVDPPPGWVPLERLDVVDLTATHPGSQRGVKNVSFTVQRGTITVVTGRVGAGKTTLLHALLGLMMRDGGEIRWNGALVNDPAGFSCHRSVPSRRRSHACSARRSARTSCSGIRPTTTRSIRPFGRPSWSPTSQRSTTDWTRSSARGESSSPEGRCSGQPLHACSSGDQSSSSSTT
jgi:ABC-type multidrug transport system fused ATPase/permease subunit